MTNTPLLYQYVKFKSVTLSVLFLIIFITMMFIFKSKSTQPYILHSKHLPPETDLWESCAKRQECLREWGRYPFLQMLEEDRC